MAISVGSDTYSIETVVAFLLERARDIAKKTAETDVRDCVITVTNDQSLKYQVPPFFTQYQRQAIVDAAKLVGLNVLAFLTDNTAAAINFAIERDFDSNQVKAIFYDMGSSSTKVSLIHFSGTPDEKNKNKTISNSQIISWD
ncbi:MAG: Hsp70 family protein [Actinobacteria bacterium]|nr:Hsp70 family protein [Actinomycetota bacterium]